MRPPFDDIEELFLLIDANLSSFWTRDHLERRKLEILALSSVASEVLAIEMQYEGNYPEGMTLGLLRHTLVPAEGEMFGSVALEYAFSVHADMVTFAPSSPFPTNGSTADLDFDPPSSDRLEAFSEVLRSRGFLVVDYADTMRPYTGNRSHPMNPDLLAPGEEWGTFTWNQVLFR